jgi:hypothetical protein
LHQLLGIVLSLDQRSQTFLPNPIEIARRERRVHDDVGHDWQRVGKARRWHVQIDERRIIGRSRRKVGAEEVDGVGDFERASRARAFVQHVRGQAGEAELARGVNAGAGFQGELYVRERHLVARNDPDLQAVGERASVDGWHTQCRRWTDGRRPRAIGCGRLFLLECRGRRGTRDDQPQDADGQSAASHFTGSTVSSTRRPSGRK